MIVPFGAGGPTDALARIVAERMRGALGQAVLVENVTGASGTIGVGRVARAAADGYTMVLGNWPSFVVASATYANLPYDVTKDFEPIAQLPNNPYIVVSKKDLPAKDLKELIAYIKANPGKLSAGTGGAGSGQHVSGVYFQKVTGTSFTFVPYRAGSADVMRDLTAGHIDLSFDQAISALPFVRSGQVRAYAITGKTRLASAPDIPTVDEAGAPGVYISTWFGLWAPKGTPAEAVGEAQRRRAGGARRSGGAEAPERSRPGNPARGPAGRARRSPRISRPSWTSGPRSSRTPTSRWM